MRAKKGYIAGKRCFFAGKPFGETSFILRANIQPYPQGARVATANPIIKTKLDPLDHNKIIEYRTRVTWGRASPTDHPTASSTIDTTAAKLFLNSAVSDHTAVLSTVDVDDFYLNSKLLTPAYLKVPLRFLPPVTRAWLKVDHLPPESSILFEVYNALYGMDDAGRISQQDLIAHLIPHGFHMFRHTPGLFYHTTRSSFRFTTWVDDFLIKSDPNTDDLAHFIKILKLKYPIKFVPVATSYIGYNLNLFRHPTNPSLDSLTISMNDYATTGLRSLDFKQTSRQNSPIIYTPPSYGGAIQQATLDDTPLATTVQQSFLRQAVGIFRYYADAIDSTLSLVLSRLAVQQTKPTIATMATLDRMLNYIATYPNATIVYRPSNMQLAVHSGESYNSEPRARSRSTGFSTCGPIIYTPGSPSNSVNGPIRTTTTVIPTVVSSATEASYAALFLNAQNATVDRQTLTDLGHPQLPTIITHDNEPAGNIAHRTAKIKRSKAIDMRYHWIQDRVELGHFILKWAPGTTNLADFPSKAHPIHHFLSIRPFFVTYPSAPLSAT